MAKEEEYEVRSNQSSDSFGIQKSKLIEENLSKEPNEINMLIWIFKVGDDLRKTFISFPSNSNLREIYKQNGLNIYTYYY